MMTRTITLAAAAFATTALLIGTATSADAQTAAHYVAKPVAAGKASVITRSTPWTLRNGQYLAARAPDRAAVLCQLLARDVGALESFSAGGQAFDGDALAKCNARAKGGTATAMAATAR